MWWSSVKLCSLASVFLTKFCAGLDKLTMAQPRAILLCAQRRPSGPHLYHCRRQLLLRAWASISHCRDLPGPVVVAEVHAIITSLCVFIASSRPTQQAVWVRKPARSRGLECTDTTDGTEKRFLRTVAEWLDGFTRARLSSSAQQIHVDPLRSSRLLT
jgi:hypothetical protein